jgi:ABC-type Fe3+/spermidine/putrescine transport system ATPase subunit
VLRPRLLLLDEPFAALDERTRERLCMELKSLQHAWGMTVVHVSHSLDEALMVADRLCMLDAGRIAQTGTPEEIMRRPSCRFVALFTGCQNVVEGEVGRLGDQREFRSGELRLQVSADHEGAAELIIRAEDIRLSTGDGPHGPNVLSGTVRSVFDRGVVVKIAVDADGVAWIAHASRQEAALLRPTVGERILLELPLESLHLLACPGVDLPA